MLKEFRDKIPDGLDTKVFKTNFLPEAFSPDGQLDDPRRAEVTLGQLLCMTGGYTGEGGAPTAVVMGRAFPLKAVPGQSIRDLDESSLHCAMWTNAGAGYSYSSPGPHIASMVLRRITGMPALTGLPQPDQSHERDDWKPIPRTPFHEGSMGGDDGIRRVLEMVCAAVRG